MGIGRGPPRGEMRAVALLKVVGGLSVADAGLGGIPFRSPITRWSESKASVFLSPPPAVEEAEDEPEFLPRPPPPLPPVAGDLTRRCCC